MRKEKWLKPQPKRNGLLGSLFKLMAGAQEGARDNVKNKRRHRGGQPDPGKVCLPQYKPRHDNDVDVDSVPI